MEITMAIFEFNTYNFVLNTISLLYFNYGNFPGSFI